MGSNPDENIKLTTEQSVKELKKLVDLEPLEAEDFIKELSKKSGYTVTKLKEQFNRYKKNKRERIEKESKNQPTENLSQKIGNAFDKKDLAERIIDIQPCYYDKARSWWLWNWSETKWERVDETDILNAVDKQATINTINSKEKNEMIEALKQVSRLNAPEPIGINIVQFNNEIINIETGEKRKATPMMFVTNPIPYELDENGFFETPTIDRIFEEWVGKDHIQTLYEILAYCLIPNYPIHRIFCFIGSGLNGKSCFLNLLRKFVGTSNCCSTELDTLLQSRFEVTRLHKKLVCQMGETDFNEMSKTSILKKISGGDLVGFEYKNKDPFEEINYAKIIIATNNLPTTTDKTIGFYRRWMIVDFPNQFSEKIDILKEIPEEEYSALAVKCSFILKDLLKNRSFTNEGSIEERMERYESRSNFLKQFIDTFTGGDINGYITKADFFKKFSAWCKEKRYREMSDSSVGAAMKKLNIESGKKSFDWAYDGKGGQLRVWLGLQWKE